MRKILIILAMLVVSAAANAQMTKKELADLKAKAAAGDYAAQCNYARALALGDGMKADLAKGVACLEELMADYPDSGYAAHVLGSVYLQMENPDTVQAILMFNRGAERNSTYSLNVLGGGYLFGGLVEVDYQRAESYFRRSVELESPSGNFYMGYMYFFGLGHDFDKVKGVEYFNKAYELKSDYAARILGDCYFYGVDNVVAQDFAKAAECYRNGIKWGDNSLYYDLANLYRVSGDIDQADRYYTLALENGVTEAAADAAYMYGDNNQAKAIEWFQRGDKAGSTDCSYGLGMAYKWGVGVKQDNKKALAYLSKDTSDRAYYEMSGIYFSMSQSKDKKHAQENFMKSVEYATKAASMGNLAAANDLARAYASGNEYLPADPAKSVSYFQQMADSGSAEGQYVMGLLYEEGNMIAQDSVKALYYMRQAAEQGHNGARCILGDYYKEGRFVEEKNLTTALSYYMSAAENGSSGGYYMVGRCYQAGWGVDIDTNKAVEYFTIAAQMGRGQAADKLGDIYNYGTLDIVPNRDSALAYYFKAADAGVGNSCYVLGRALVRDQAYEKAVSYLYAGAKDGHGGCIELLAELEQHGLGIAQNVEEAYQLFEIAATRYGNAVAYNEMGYARLSGYGCQEDEALAKAYFDTSANLGYARGMYNVALCYKDGIGCSQDYALYVQYLRQAASLDYVYAINSLARLNAEGLEDVMEKNEAEAFKLYKYSAEKLGSLEGITQMGNCYEEGVGVYVNTDSAIYYYTMAAENGYGKAMHYLAVLYSQDYYLDGSTEDDEIHIIGDSEKALEWLIKAADAGYVYSQYVLATQYEEGTSLIKADKKMAKKYYMMAAEQDFEPAKAALNRLK